MNVIIIIVIPDSNRIFFKKNFDPAKWRSNDSFTPEGGSKATERFPLPEEKEVEEEDDKEEEETRNNVVAPT